MSDGEGDDDDKRASKKRKATRACDRCNSQHQPCDNSLPKCSVCERAGVECTYDRPIRKRGPRVGYTSQNGERLWSVVLKARPEIEDLVLQLLRDGTYGDSGVPNAQFIKNNDNQTELVNYFNDSRIGRFLQHGDSEALRIPPPEQKYAIVPTERLQGLGNGHSSRGIGGLLNDASPSSGPHGAPQNPGDIYLQSDDIGRRKVQVQHRPAGSPPVNSHSPGVNSQRAAHSEISNKYTSSVGDSWKECNPFSYLDPPRSKRPAPDPTPEPASSARSESRAPSSGFTPATFDIGSMEMSHWFDPIPADTLLNLGFDGGESMAQDWFELCENPDPVVDKSAVSPAVTTTSLGEDEEEVWRRLVMRGRFM